MKVVTILGSPRPESNTKQILAWLEEKLADSGHECKRFNLIKMDVKPCLADGHCKDIHDGPGCIQKDDGADVLKAMVEADAVVIASPLYFWGLSGLTKTMLDRFYSFYWGSRANGDFTSLMAGKKGALILTCAGPYENNAEEAVTTFRRTMDWIQCSNQGELVVTGCTTPEELDQNWKGSAAELAEKLCA